MAVWTPSSELAQAVYKAGFLYDRQYDHLYSRKDAWQRAMGYNWAYDVAASRLQMIIDCEPFYFSYLGRPWLIELWKGQYGYETGAEIGVYSDERLSGRVPMPCKARHYECKNPNDELSMNFRLFRDGEELMQRSGLHWWLTGFRWGVFTRRTTDLRMDVSLRFKPPDKRNRLLFKDWNMRDEFVGALARLGYLYRTDGDRGVSFVFERPVTPQPPERAKVESRAQDHNERLVDEYNAYKASHGIKTNDPNEFTSIGDDLKAGLVSSIRPGTAAPAKGQGRAPVVPAKLAQASGIGRKVQQQAKAAVQQLQSQASQALQQLGLDPGRDRQATLHAICQPFDRKVWHVVR